MYRPDTEFVRISSVKKEGFFRCGVAFPFEGVVLPADAFSDADWERLKTERFLKVLPADAPEAAAPALPDPDELLDVVMTIIPRLAPEDFGASGKASLDAIRAQLDPRFGAEHVTGALRDEAMKTLLKGGFKAPERTPG